MTGAPFTFDFGEGIFAGFSVVLFVLLIGFALAFGLILWVIVTSHVVGRSPQWTRLTVMASPPLWPLGGRVAKSLVLLGISLLPAIPILVLLVPGLMVTGAWVGLPRLRGSTLTSPCGQGLELCSLR